MLYSINFILAVALIIEMHIFILLRLELAGIWPQKSLKVQSIFHEKRFFVSICMHLHFAFGSYSQDVPQCKEVCLFYSKLSTRLVRSMAQEKNYCKFTLHIEIIKKLELFFLFFTKQRRLLY